jgi:deoxycytidylate deaminase
MGTPVKGCVMYLNWWPLPCPDCARAIIQSGITTVIGPNKPFKSGTKTTLDDLIHNTQVKGDPIDWKKSFETTQAMFTEAGVEIIVYNMPGVKNET